MSVRLCLAIAVLTALAAPASADRKVVVLGLEVKSTIDIPSTTVARELTDGLRGAVRSVPRHQLAPNSNKELVDERVIENCDNEAVDCMTKIAKKYRADVMLYGSITRKKRDAVDGYEITLVVLDVEKMSRKPPSVTWVRMEETTGQSIELHAGRAYHEAMDHIGPVTSDSTSDKITLTERAKPSDPKTKSRNRWKLVAGISGIVALGPTAYGFYYWNRLANTGSSGFLNYGGDCGNPRPDQVEDCKSDNGHSLRNKTWVALPLAIVLGSFTGYALYKGFIQRDDSEARPAGEVGTRQRKRTGFAVTPIIGPDGGGATVRFDW